MSKFVTYPAVTVLDNDHSLLIDSPNAGTNSITANNAADTLLSKWSGFDTFDEAVQNTISNNQEFIDRDAAIRGETAELKRKIVTTFPAKDASGQIATFESEFEDAPLKSCIVQVAPVQDLHGYDHPWPAGGGKNKFNEVYPSLVSALRYMSIFVGDGTYTLSTSTPLNTENATNLFLLAGNVSSGASTADNGVYAGHPKTVESVDGYVTIAYRNANGVNPASYETQLESGSTATSYVPYENICPISGFTGCEVTRNSGDYAVFGVTTGKTLNTSGEAVNESGMGVSDWMPVNTGDTVTLKYVSTIGGRTRRVIGYDENKAFVSILSSVSWANVGQEITQTVTVESGVKYIRASFFVNDTNKSFVNESSVTTYPISFPSEAGTVYGAYVDVVNGELVVDRAMVDFDGSSDEDWLYYAIGQGNLFRLQKYSAMKPTENIIPAISNAFKPVLQTNRTSGTISSGIGGTNVDFIFDGVNSLAEWREWLAENNVQLCYELAEPIHYHLTHTEIKTLLGTNNIWANTGDTSVEYLMSDVGWYVEKKLRAFQSILAGVEDSAVASKNYSTDSYLIFNDDIYKTTKAITAGETIEEGVNVTKTTVAEQLMALAQA